MAVKSTTVWRKWKLLASQHEDNDREGKARIYRAGDIFESKCNLEDFNGHGMAKKFERMDDDTKITNGPGIEPGAPRISPSEKEAASPPGVQKDEELYDAMTLDELKKFAKEEEVNLGGAKTKEEIIKQIRAQVKA